MNHLQAAEACFTKQANFLTELMAKLEQNPELKQRILAGLGGAAGGAGIGALAGGGQGAGLGALLGGGAGAVSPEIVDLVKSMLDMNSTGLDAAHEPSFQDQINSANATAISEGRRAFPPNMGQGGGIDVVPGSSNDPFVEQELNNAYGQNAI